MSLLLVHCGHPRGILRRRCIAGVTHAQRIEERALHEGRVGSARHDLNHATEDEIACARIVLIGSGLEQQRRPRDRRDDLRQLFRAPGFGQRAADAIPALARRRIVRETRGVDQELPDRNCVVSAGEIHLAGKFRKIFFNGIVEAELAVLRQLHDRRGRDRLRHRGDPADRVGTKSDTAIRVAEAERSLAKDLTVAGDENRRAGNLAILNRLLHQPKSRIEVDCGGGGGYCGCAHQRNGHAAHSEPMYSLPARASHSVS